VNLSSSLHQALASAADSAPTVLAASDWLTDTPSTALPELYRAYGAQFEQALAIAVSVLGPPFLLLPFGGSRSPDWYPEALRFASWKRGSDTFYVALVHHDRECPVAVEAGLVSEASITERSQ
jgi:hypothetical protein